MRKDLTTPPMENNKLHPDWQKRAEELYPVSESQHPAVLEHNTNQILRQESLTKGSTLMRDRVEKKLKDKEAEVNKDFVFTDEDEYRQPGKLSLLEELLFELKNITPND